MTRRTTVEIDNELLERAKHALDLSTNRATVEEALRRAVNSVADEQAERAARKLEYLESSLRGLISTC